MLTRTRRRLFSEYIGILRSQVIKQDIKRIRHGWKKSKWIVRLYFTVCFSPETVLTRVRAFADGKETWDNFTGFYAPIVVVSRWSFVVGILGRLAVPAYLLFFYTPALGVGDYTKIIIASTLWCILAYVIEHEAYAATEESDLFLLVAKFDRKYNLSKK